MLSMAAILILLIESISVFNAAGPGHRDGILTRVFDGPIRTVTIENAAGATEVTSWTGATVRLTAVKAIGDNSQLESVVSSEQTGDVLRITVKPDSATPINLAVYVPVTAHVSVRGGKGSVVTKSITAGLSAETDSGSILIHLTESSQVDLSLRSIQGLVDSRLPVSVFGKSDPRMLDGRLGRGGPAVIARSRRGNISILPGDASTLEAKERGTSTISPNLTARMALAASPPPNEHNVGSEDAIKLEARLVNLNVKVTDAGGKTLPALTKEDFAVFEDAVQQEIAHFEPITAPLHIVLLLDLSGSTEKKMKVMKKAAQRFVDSVKPTDNIAVAGFTRRFFIISNFSTNHKLIKDRIDDIKNRHSGTAYYDAMWATLDLLDEANATRKAIVVMTDGVDNSLSDPDDSDYDPKHGFDELFARIEEADATIYPIYLDTEYETIGRSARRGHEAYVTARKQLEAVADQTGAEMFRADSAEDLEGVYQRVAAELHSLYSIAYAPKTLRKDGKWKRIGLTVSLRGAKARTKKGYFAK